MAPKVLRPLLIYLTGLFLLSGAASFLNGLFAGSVPVAMAYASDVYPTQSETDSEIGLIIALNCLGSTGGGLIAVFMQSVGLFEPLLVGAPLSLAAGVLCQVFLIEPSKDLYKKTDDAADTDEEAPNTLEIKPLVNILVGSAVDYFGSTGLLPFCMAPLLYTVLSVRGAHKGLKERI